MAKGKFIKGGILGAIAGVLGGLLMAPKSGKETRDDIKKAADKASARAEKQLKELYDELQKRSEEARAKGEELKGKAQKELDDLAGKADIVREKIGETITALREGEAVADDEVVTQVEKDGKAAAKKITEKVKPKK